MRTRALAAIAASVACAVALSGCIAFQPIGFSQGSVGAPVTYVITLCANEAQAPINHPGCEFETNSGDSGDSEGEVQLLLAVQAPVGTGAPPTLTGTEPEPGKAIAFTRSPSYEAELNKFVPPSAGLQWIGWISDVYDHDAGADGTPARATTVEVDLALPAGPNGGPFDGPFSHRWVAGGRAAGEGEGGPLPATRPVDCGEFVYANPGPTTCIDYPSPAFVEGPTDAAATRDFGVTAGAATVSPGQSVDVPFQLATNGAIAAGTTATLAATTTLPGVTLTPNPASVQLESAQRQAVTVPTAVPAGAGPGSFDVVVTASLPNGQRRTGTAKLTVRDTQAPVLRGRVSLRPKRFRPSAPALIAASGTRVSYSLSEPATVRFFVRRCKRVKRRTRCKQLKGVFLHQGAAGRNTVRFSGFLRNKALPRGNYQLVLTPVDAAKNRGKAKRVKFGIRK